MGNAKVETRRDVAEWLEEIAQAEYVADIRKIAEALTDYAALVGMPNQIQYKIRTALHEKWDDLEQANEMEIVKSTYYTPYEWFSELLGNPLFIGMLFMINAQETETELATIRAQIDEQALDAFGEDGADLFNVYMNDRMHLLRVGIAQEHPGVNYILEHGVQSLEPTMELFVEQMAEVQEQIDEIELLVAESPSKKNN